ncbi:MAG: hypothetical protein L0Z73_06775 [Gammaproteobacteria bacterium]|nr:hypothetical protein [Gammaproteobacteria bacterium]
MTKYVLLCLLGFLIHACAGTLQPARPMAHQVVKPGAILKLNRDLTIPPDQAGVRMQYGKFTEYRAINQWYPNCRFEVKNPAPAEQIIQPEEFVITQVSTEFQFVAAEQIKLAAFGIGIGMFGNNGGPTAEVMSTSFYIQSQTQPKVRRLICQHWEDPYDSRHLLLEEIQQALGDIIEFRLTPAL